MEKWELAYQDYLNKMKYKDIAEKHDVSINTVKSWKSRKWNAPPEKKVAHKTKKVAHKKEVPKAVVELVDSDELTEQQKTFCLLYLKYKFNQTKAYREAYDCDYRTAHANSYRLMANDGIRKHIKALKLEIRNSSFIDLEDVIEEYRQQFSADITDYVKFGKKEIEIRYDDGSTRIKEVNYVDFKESDEVDGTIIKNVRMGKDGPVVELYDKQKAMSELMKYLGGDELRQAQINKLNKSMEVDNRTEDKLKNYFEALGAEIDGIE